MVVVIPLVPKSLGGAPEIWEARLLDYGAGERLQGTIETVVEDTSPSLGGNLDLAGFVVVDGVQEVISWNGTTVEIEGLPVFKANINAPADQEQLLYNQSLARWQNGLPWANSIQFDDTVAQIGETDVQGALEFLAAAGGGGGGMAQLFDDKSPQLGGDLQLGHPSESTRNFTDHNGAWMIDFSPVGSAVNYLQILNAATGNSPTVRAVGSDANVDLQLLGKGTGAVKVTGNLKVGTDILDANGNIIIALAEVAAAVNYLSVANNITANEVQVKALGADANIGLHLEPKGSGYLDFGAANIRLQKSDTTTIFDRNDNELLAFNAVTSATTYLSITNAVGNAPMLATAGGAADQSLILSSKGASGILFKGGTGTIDIFRAVQTGASPVNYVQVQAVQTGNDVIIRGDGADVNIGINIVSKGTGTVKVNGSQVMTTPAPSNGDIWYYNSGFQRLAKGTDGQVLTLATGLPSWSTGGGGGGDMLKSTYDPALIAEQLVGLTATQTLTNKTLSANRVINGIYDQNGLLILTLPGAGSAVNYLQIRNSPTGTPLDLLAQGTDANVGIQIGGKGTGVIELLSALQLDSLGVLGSNGNEIFLTQDAASAVNYLTLYNSNTGVACKIGVAGSDANINFEVAPKGTGKFVIANGSELQLGNDVIYGNGGNRVLTLTDAGDGNRVDIISLGTGNPATIRAIGVDANVDLKIYGKGTGKVIDTYSAQYAPCYECEVVGSTGGAVGNTEATAQLATMTQWGGANASEQYSLDTTNDDVTVPLAGDYEIIGVMSVDKSDSGAGNAWIKIQTDRTASFADEANTDFAGAVNGTRSGFCSTRCTVTLADGDKVRLRHNSDATTMSVRNLRLHIRRIHD